MHCPRCNQELTKEYYQKKIIFRCPECSGQYITISALRGLTSCKELVNRLWLHGNRSQAEGKICPGCRKYMREIFLPVKDGIVLELDVCISCQSVWFDPTEMEHIPLPEPEQIDALPPRAKQILALRRLQLEERKKQTFNPSELYSSPDEFWKILPALLGMPVEKDSLPLSGYPIFTWLITGICVLIFAVLQLGNPEIIQQYGFIPSAWSRYGGITILSSMILHASWQHLLGNMYFFLIFGDNVEDLLGHSKYLLFLLLSGLSATFFYFVFNSSSTLPCVGASGFISGVIAGYAILFPRAKLSFLYCRYIFTWLTIPAWLAFTLWMILQIVFSTVPQTGGGIAYIAHLGGAAAGIILALVWQMKFKKKSIIPSLVQELVQQSRQN